MLLCVVPLQSVVQHFQRMCHENVGFVQAGYLKVERIAAFVLGVGIGIGLYVFLYHIFYCDIVTADAAHAELDVLVGSQRFCMCPIGGAVHYGNTFSLPGIGFGTVFHLVQTGRGALHKGVLLAVECLVLNVERRLETVRLEHCKSCLRIFITFQHECGGIVLRCFNVSVIGRIGTFACNHRNHCKHQQPQS